MCLLASATTAVMATISMLFSEFVVFIDCKGSEPYLVVPVLAACMKARVALGDFGGRAAAQAAPSSQCRDAVQSDAPGAVSSRQPAAGRL